MQTSKPAIAHLRNFKRFVKLLTTNLIDIYPAKSEYLPAIIQEVRNLSRQKMRLIRFSATYIGMQFFKQLLCQMASLYSLKSTFSSQPSV